MVADYNNRKSKLIKSFKKYLERSRTLLVSRFGEKEAKGIIVDAIEEYIRLIPQIPFIGKKNPMLLFFLPTVRCLAIYRTLQKHGISSELAGHFIYDSVKIEMEAIPTILRRLANLLWFSSIFRNRIKRRAIVSQDRKYKGDFVFSYIDGENQDFDFGIDYIECANCKFLQIQNAIELAPYICETDRIASEVLGWGLIRTKTLADGKEQCDFRFKKSGKTYIQGSTIQIKY